MVAYVSNHATIKALDDYAEHTLGVSPIALMEAIGTQLGEIIQKAYPCHKRIVCLAGPGNNGGDALVIARYLHNFKEVSVIQVGSPQTEPCRRNLLAYRNLGGTLWPVEGEKDFKKVEDVLKDADLIIDGLLGIGFKPPLSQLFLNLIALVNAQAAPKIAIDMPSGVVADTGETAEHAIVAQRTLAIVALKPGHLLHPGCQMTGEVSIHPLAVPWPAPPTVSYVNEVLAHKWQWQRSPQAHKYSVGRVLIIAGSKRYPGAAVLAAQGALAAGAGLVELGIPENIIASAASHLQAPILLPLPYDGDSIAEKAIPQLHRALSRADVVCVGPGLTTASPIRVIVKFILQQFKGPLVLDADALNVLQLSDMQRSDATIVITPHLRELERLIDKPITSDYHRLNVAQGLAQEIAGVVVAKGAPTITVTPSGYTYVNGSGNAALAVAGAGDVLSGVLSALLAQGLPEGRASALACYLHGRTADIYTRRYAQVTFQPQDIINLLPQAFADLIDEH